MNSCSAFCIEHLLSSLASILLTLENYIWILRSDLINFVGSLASSSHVISLNLLHFVSVMYNIKSLLFQFEHKSLIVLWFLVLY